MTPSQISAASLSVLNLSYYGCRLRDPSRSLKYKTASLVSADRCFDQLTDIQSKANSGFGPILQRFVDTGEISE
jgi:hypothetical protein